MNLQIIKDGQGTRTGIFIPISDWDVITAKHEDLKQLIPVEQPIKKKLSELAGALSSEVASNLLKHVEESRKGWDDRLNKQTK